ncbi:MAG: tRNA (N6-isopentenyl adenosine(37)-C2)-methylthiotransferase MiaB [Prevotellaceae bacterium]|jgi:tRNA-2-methylthio-N6-dimethylallyladenosine synthase|nr:tRNA (N6-isopentenyl adenosine(37)-C2)-methylthiotransferase MiaB [Prevotellaceae bacterium]
MEKTNNYTRFRIPAADEQGKRLYIETYGCQMNVNDSEVVAAIMQQAGFTITGEMAEADVIFVNTCSVRDNAEQRVWGRLAIFRLLKQQRPGLVVGVLGCMAERLKEALLENGTVDIVAGPDAYRALPKLVREAESGQRGINTLLSHEETYADISPVRMDRNGVTAFVSIMRGCNNVCAYCVVPYTRGAERSRPSRTIIREVQTLFKNGYREVTLLGQNVNSYCWKEAGAPDSETVTFARLLEMVALLDPSLRVRFSTSHPKDMHNDVLYTMAMYPNICNHIHLPVQSGSNRMLEKMNRGYSRERYLERIAKIREIIPECSLSTDLIAGFCGETDDDHAQTLSLMRVAGYDAAFMFQYSERPNTKAARHFADDVPEGVKNQRLNEIIALQNRLSLESNRRDVQKTFTVLAEGDSKRSEAFLFGRTSHNKVVVFPKAGHKAGDYVSVRITECSSATLIGVEDAKTVYPPSRGKPVLF